MSSKDPFITEENLLCYPELKAFIASNPADVNLLSKSLEYEYRFKFDEVIQDLTVTQLCSFNGKIVHLKALASKYGPLTAEIKKRSYRAIQYAAKNGHTATIEHLETNLTEQEKKEAAKNTYNLKLNIPLSDIVKLVDTGNDKLIFIKNNQFKYIYANNNFLQVFNLNTPKGLIGLSDKDIYREKQHIKTYRQDCEQVIETKIKNEVADNLVPKKRNAIETQVQGGLYPLFTDNTHCVQYVLGIFTLTKRLMKLDWDTIFSLSTIEISHLLKQQRYNLTINQCKISLSRREIQVLIEMFKGNHAGEIADILSLKQTTIESYQVNLKNKLGVISKGELINLVISSKLLTQIIV